MSHVVFWRRAVLVLAAGAVLGISACSKDADKKEGAAAEKLREAPDFGGVRKQYVEAEGVGPTPADAVDEALLSAVKQVNGAAIDATGLKLNIATSMSSSAGDLDLSAQAFADMVATRSGGVVSDFKILSQKKSSGLFGKGKTEWTVKIGANIAKYQASADANRPRIVVAAPRTRLASFTLGNGTRPADAVQASIRARITDALSQTNRFTVLDREFTDEIQNEMDLIASGAVNKDDTSRLGQMLATDLIVVPTIERFEYTRHARQLRLADRELVSYSGGARISFRVLNATTGQMVMSDTYAVEFPTTNPTTLGASVDADGASERAMAGMTEQFVSKLLQRTFPISVISLSGTDVVLSQGGAAVKEGMRYRAVILGEELKDPQTGQSLGRTDRDFGTVIITRSEPNVAYGQLEGAPTLKAGQFRPGLIEVREQLGGAQTPPVQATATAPTADQARKPARATRPQSATPTKVAAAAKPVEDENW